MTEQCQNLIGLIRQGKLHKSGCAGRRYQLQQPAARFRDCLVFYLDGRIHFERWCYGEAAGLSGEAWCRNMDPQGKMLWEAGKGEVISAVEEAPKELTGCSEDGTILYFDGSDAPWKMVQDLRRDKNNGYSGLLLLWRKWAKSGQK